MTQIHTPIDHKGGIYWRDASCTQAFYDQEAAALLWRERYGIDLRATARDEANAKLQTRAETIAAAVRVFGAFALMMLAVAVIVGSVSLWSYLTDAAYIPHDEMTIVYAPYWEFGE